MRLRSPLVAAALAAALALAGCAAGNVPEAGESPGMSPEQGTAPLTIAKPDGPITTQNNNPWIAQASGVTLGYIYAILEPLAIVNLIDPTGPAKPWLAQEIAWAPDYHSVTLTPRDGVSWSDGEPFTAEDIAFTFTLIKDHPELDIGALGISDVAVQDNAVTVSFEHSAYVKQDKVLHTLVVPEHRWSEASDPATYDNPDPVGTGPYQLADFTGQSVELTARDGYWGGTVAVPQLFYVSYNDNTALTTALANGEADWAQAFIPNLQSNYLDKDPANHYWAPAGLGVDAMFVNTTTKPFDDVAFRRAVDLVVDRGKHAAIAREGAVPALSSVTGLPTPGGDAFIAEPYRGQSYAVDVAGARAVLEEAGYSWQGETLHDPDGEPVTFAISIPQGWSDYVTGASLIADSVRTLGVAATTTTPDADTWWVDRAKGDFQAILHWTDTGNTGYDLYSDTMDGRWLKPAGQEADYNFGRFDDTEATKELETYAEATDDAARMAAMARIQQIFMEQAPAMPIGTRPFIGEYNSRSYVGWPDENNPYVNPDPTEPSTVLILTELTPAG